MKLSTRTRATSGLPGLRGTTRADRRPRALLPRLASGDIAVIDHLDLDRSTAQGYVDAGVAGVVNARPMLSGRYPALGPLLLAEAGVVIVDDVGPEGFAMLRDGRRVRLEDGGVYAGEELLASGRGVDVDVLRRDMEAARAGLVAQLESFTHNSTEFLRREQDLLLHGVGVPRLSVRVAGRPVVVVVDAHDHRDELRAIRRYIREQDPVLVGVDSGADALAAAGLQPHVVVLESSARDEQLPTARTLRRAQDVVLRVDRGSRAGSDRFERLGVRTVRFESGAAAEDAALVLADVHEAGVIVGVGLHATLDDFLDRQRPGLASTFLTRLRVGARLVDARTLPQLYSGRVRPWHLVAVYLAALVALLAAVSVTPVGRELWDAALPALQDLLDRLRDLLS